MVSCHRSATISLHEDYSWLAIVFATLNLQCTLWRNSYDHDSYDHSKMADSDIGEFTFWLITAASRIVHS